VDVSRDDGKVGNPPMTRINNPLSKSLAKGGGIGLIVLAIFLAAIWALFGRKAAAIVAIIAAAIS